eukprot:936382-Prorocentrum_lima.AAC.1
MAADLGSKGAKWRPTRPQGTPPQMLSETEASHDLMKAFKTGTSMGRHGLAVDMGEFTGPPKW